MNKTQNSGWSTLLRISLIIFFSATILNIQAQCPTVSAIPISTNICSTTTTSIELKSDVPGTAFSWTSASKDVAGGTDGTGFIIANTLSAMESLTGSVVYTITPTANGCKGTPATVTIKVNPIPTVTAIPISSTISSGTAASISLTSDVAETAFSWTVSRSGVIGAAAGSGSGINQTISTTAKNGSATYRVTPNFNGCAGNSINVKVIVVKK